MYPIDFRHFFILFFILFYSKINMVNSNHEDHHRFEIIYRSENDDVDFLCVLMDVAWWKRPNLLATRYGVILPKFRSKMSLTRNDNNLQAQILHLHRLESNDSGIYECETLGAIQQFNLTVIVRLTTVEFGSQSILSYDSTNGYVSNQTDPTLLHQSLILKNDQIHLRENQLIRLTCVVSRAFPAASLHFPFDIDYRIERNSTIENNDKTYRTILVLILRIHRSFHQRTFHCEATQNQIIKNENQSQQLRILSNTLQMDVAYSPICSDKIALPSQFYTGIHRSINLTCHMFNGNPSKINFTWHLPNGDIRIGYYLNTTSSYITILPTDTSDFGDVICRAHNEIGLFGECHVNMVLGGIPDPVQSCHHTYLNSTLTVNCRAGYHQGDEDFFCYMYKRQHNGSYSEHARLKGNCAFILPDLKPEHHHDFLVFTKNKFGDNFDRSYSIKVGKPRAETFAEKTRIYWPYMVLLILGACVASLILICCSYHKIRKALYNKRKSKGNFESLTYQNDNSHHNHHANSNGKTALVHLKQNGNGATYPVRPYRSKDHLIPYESSTLYRNNVPFKSIYSADDEIISSRRNTLRETDLDQIFLPPNDLSNGTVKTLPINRIRTIDSQQEGYNESNEIPLTTERRSSFQVATKMNNLDFYTKPESFYFLDKQVTKSTHRNHYSPSHYQEKRREFSPYHRTDSNQQNNLIMENTILTNGYSNRRQSREKTSLSECNRENSKDNKKFILNNHEQNDDHCRDDGIFV